MGIEWTNNIRRVYLEYNWVKEWKLGFWAQFSVLYLQSWKRATTVQWENETRCHCFLAIAQYNYTTSFTNFFTFLTLTSYFFLIFFYLMVEIKSYILQLSISTVYCYCISAPHLPPEMKTCLKASQCLVSI